MAHYGSDDVAFFLLGGFDLRSNLTDFSDNTEAIIEDTTVLGSSWMTQEGVGLARADISANGFYDDGALKSVAALATRQGTERILSYGLEGNSAGKNFVSFQGAVEAKVSRVASRGAFHKLNTELKGSGKVEHGKILAPLGTTNSATGNTQASPVDNGASSTSGVAYQHINALTLDTATGFKSWVRHSSDDVTYADLITFVPTTSTGAAVVPNAQRIASTATVERYLAAAWEFGTTAAAGGATRSATFMIGFGRTT